MNTKLKRFFISFILIIIFYLTVATNNVFWKLELLRPHVGILFVVGLLFGPYGALGASVGNIIIDLYSGYTPIEILPSALASFGVSYLAYKIWYSGFLNKEMLTPNLDNVKYFILFLIDLLICGIIYSIFHNQLLFFLFEYNATPIGLIYFMNFINIAFISGIILILICKKSDLIDFPKTSKKHAHEKLYRIIFAALMIITAFLVASAIIKVPSQILIAELILTLILLYAYLTKPFKYKVNLNKSESIIGRIMDIFLITTLIIALIGISIYILASTNAIIHIDEFEQLLPTLSLFIITDIIILLYLIPGLAVLEYLERKVTRPIKSFSEIEEFIEENEKIESEGLINIYSKYINEEDELGKLSRTYTELIEYNNEYIENIAEIEGEKERIKAELDIATRIQASNLPNEPIENDYFTVNGYSHPAKEVGGDFFDYYEVDEDTLAIAIGDASGKGVPAAILSTITQSIIKQLVNHERDPSKVLYNLNNQLCQNNSESMFITLWLGLYNKKTHKMIFSNAGHNTPLIKESDKFKYLNIDTGLVLGVMDDFEFMTEEISDFKEIILYTDGITDANNKNNEMYGEDRLLNFFNKTKTDNSPIQSLLKNVNEFAEGTEQYDDMTVLYLKIKG